MSSHFSLNSNGLDGAETPRHLKSRIVHHHVTDTKKMEVLEKVNALGCWEWRLHTYSDEQLCLIGGGNLVYSHTAEVCFSGVRFVCCPARLMHAQFRLATWLETPAIGMKVELDSATRVIVIEAETTASITAEIFYIVAEKIELQQESAAPG